MYLKHRTIPPTNLFHVSLAPPRHQASPIHQHFHLPICAGAHVRERQAYGDLQGQALVGPSRRSLPNFLQSLEVPRRYDPRRVRRGPGGDGGKYSACEWQSASNPVPSPSPAQDGAGRQRVVQKHAVAFEMEARNMSSSGDENARLISVSIHRSLLVA